MAFLFSKMNKEVEIWKDISGYEGLYQVSNHGRVKSIKRIVYRKDGKSRVQDERIVRASKNSNGYFVVSLYKGNEREMFRIHRLVAINFVDGWVDGYVVNHIDTDKSNNNSSNLQWCTSSYNNRHALVTGTKKVEKGSLCKNSKLLPDDVLYIRDRIRNGDKQSDIARDMKVSASTINSIKFNRNWWWI